MIESKFLEFSIDQKKLVEDTHEAINKETDRLISNKINVISVTVANQVAAQLITVFKQYMPKMERLEVSSDEAGIRPMITQDPQHSPTKTIIADSTQRATSESYEHSDMLEEINAIEQCVTPKSSPHDNILEHTEKT